MISKDLDDSEKIIILNWNRICRVCLTDDSVLYPIKNTDDHYNMCFYDMIHFCSTLDISDTEDALPQLICSLCINQLHTALEFKKNYQYATDLLTKLQTIRKDLDSEIKCEKIDIEVFSDDCTNFDNNTDVDENGVYKEKLTGVEQLPKLVKCVKNLPEKEIISKKKKRDLTVKSKRLKGSVSNKKYTCSICNIKFISTGELSKHKRIHSSTCWRCLVNFDTHEEYKEHCKNHNIKTCTECGKCFKKKDDLNKHMVKHTKIKKFLCMVCGKKYCSSEALTVHGRIHSGEKRYECSFCGKKFIHWNSMKVHVKSYHTEEKAYECNVCNKRFSIKQRLTLHIRCHTGEKPYSCTLCDKKFARRSGQRMHMFTHTGEKRIFCEVCDKGFVTNYNLRVHMVTHSGERNHACTVCSKTFTQAHVLRSHMKLHLEGKNVVSPTLGEHLTIEHQENTVIPK